MNAVRVDIGVWDWTRRSWREAFYPPDMPAAWRVAYYANEYGCAGLPARAWSVRRLAAWAEDLPESFGLWLECGREQLERADLASALAGFGARLAGVWLRPGLDAQPLRRAGIAVIGAPWDARRRAGEAAVGRYRVRGELDLRAAREVLEAFAAAPGPQSRQLLVDGAPEQLARLRELAALLGF